MAAVLLVVSAIALFTGTVQVDFRSAVAFIFGGWWSGQPEVSALDKTILFSIRLPRIVLAGLVGASLSLAGAIFQALLRNPLADPYILGLSGGSAVGAIIGMMIGAGSLPFGVPTASFLALLSPSSSCLGSPARIFSPTRSSWRVSLSTPFFPRSFCFLCPSAAKPICKTSCSG